MTPADLRQMIEAATPGPWAWDSRGEKSNEWGMGVALDANDQPIAGHFDAEDVIYCDYVCSHEATTANYADPELIAALRNQAPAILALWEAALAYFDDLEKSDAELEDALLAALERMGKE